MNCVSFFNALNLGYIVYFLWDNVDAGFLCASCCHKRVFCVTSAGSLPPASSGDKFEATVAVKSFAN